MGNVKIAVVFLTFLLAYTFASYKLTEQVEQLKKQVQMEMLASIFYQTSAHYFESSEQALHGFAKYFYDQSLEEKEHADKLLTYLNQRNVEVSNFIDLGTPNDILPKPTCFRNRLEGKNISFVVSCAVQLEKVVLKSFEDIINGSTDAQLKHFIEHEYLDEQIRSIKELSDMKSQILSVKDNTVGVLLLDRWLLEGKKKTEL